MILPQAPLIPTQPINHPLLRQKNVSLHIQREDQLHAHISGNKWRKLKYNILEAKQQGYSGVLTFGGAYSNHIAATAAAAKAHTLASVGLIRGEENVPLNPTLALAAQNGMRLHYLSREAYRSKTIPKELEGNRSQFYLIPEGGSNALAVQGCAEMLVGVEVADYDYYALACGTGGTLAGLLVGLNHRQQVLGFPALKGGSFLKTDIDALIEAYHGKRYQNYQLITDYHFGGYAKWTPELIDFINEFYSEQHIPLDPIYTGKMLFGLFDMVRQNRFKPGTKILAFHTGGLQGIAGFNQRFGNILNLA